ncbi:MAG: LON peptidase substrate-binding domain-containing protein [Rhizobacter sp.]|nr:LON peptidase substrate-binding domain-containing protein [Rhizobacter sp.]
MERTTISQPLPLLPLDSVLFPGGLLSLKVFEARYLDLMATSLREHTPFGVVARRNNPHSARIERAADLEAVGVIAELIEVDSPQAGILQVRCRGMQRFEVTEARQQDDGVWLSDANLVPDDSVVAPDVSMHATVRGLANAIATLQGQGSQPFEQPYLFDQAGWVANRWCEILPISLLAKQRLMELAEPALRLQLVDEYLRGKGVV